MTFSVDSQTIYCLATGKPIAFLTQSDFSMILDSLVMLDHDELEDELEIRTLVSMRPSTLWQSITPDSIEVMRTQFPKELLAYLLNRLYAPIKHPMTYESRIEALRYRTNLWDTLASFDFDSEQLQQLLLILLELDARFGLDNIPSARTKIQIWRSYHRENAVELLSHLAIWRDELVAKQVKETKRYHDSIEFWSTGNRQMRKAFLQSFIATKPPTRAEAKRQEKKAEVNLFDSILASIWKEEKEPTLAEQLRAESIRPANKLVAMSAAQRAAPIINKTAVIRGSATPLRFGVKS